MATDAQFFQIMGIDKRSARMLSHLLAQPNATRETMADRLALSKTDCDSAIAELESRQIVSTTTGGVVRILPGWAVNGARKFESWSREFADKLRATRFLLAEEFANEIGKAFEIRGYQVKKELAQRARVDAYRVEFAFTFTAERFYRFGVLIFSPELLSALRRKQSIREDTMAYSVAQLAEQLRCIGAFLFFDPRCGGQDVEQVRKALGAWEHVDLGFRGGHRTFFFVHYPVMSIQEFIEKALVELENKRIVVEGALKRLGVEIKAAKDVVVEDSMLLSQLNSILSGSYLPDRARSAQMLKLMAPARSVVDREGRNMGIFEREFEDAKAFYEREVDNFDKRLVIPDPDRLNEGLSDIDRLKSKFEPIRHELRALKELLFFPYVAGIVPLKVNPFILTEPNDIELFTVNQTRLVRTAKTFLGSRASGAARILFLTGAAGTGKTHALRHIFSEQGAQLGYWPIYVDCPVKYDVLSSLVSEIVQERNFPQNMQQFVTEMRKQRISSELEFVETLSKLNDLVTRQGQRGLLLLIDELENSLPYSYHGKHTEAPRFDGDDTAPLALRQLRILLSSDFGRSIAFVFALREHVLSDIKRGLKLVDFDRFVAKPQLLTRENFKDFIDLRYKIWACKKIEFPKVVLMKVLSLTKSNVRHTIQYLRALYQLALEDKRKTVSMTTLRRLGKLPLFVY